MRISDWSSDVCSSDLSFEVVAWSTREVAGSPSPERAISTSGTDRARAITEVDRVRDRFMRSLGARHGRCSGKKGSGVLDGRRDRAQSCKTAPSPLEPPPRRRVGTERQAGGGGGDKGRE